MAKRETLNLIDSFSEFKDLKNIDRSTLISVVEELFRNIIAKKYGTDENFDVIINPDKGDFEIYRNRTIVADENFQDPNLKFRSAKLKKLMKIMKLVKKSPILLILWISDEELF